MYTNSVFNTTRGFILCTIYVFYTYLKTKSLSWSHWNLEMNKFALYTLIFLYNFDYFCDKKEKKEQNVYHLYQQINSNNQEFIECVFWFLLHFWTACRKTTSGKKKYNKTMLSSTFSLLSLFYYFILVIHHIRNLTLHELFQDFINHIYWFLFFYIYIIIVLYSYIINKMLIIVIKKKIIIFNGNILFFFFLLS